MYARMQMSEKEIERKVLQNIVGAVKEGDV